MSRIFKNVVFLLLFKAVNLFATLYMTRYLLFIMGDEDYARYKEVLAILLLLIAVDLGVPSFVRNQFSMLRGGMLKRKIQITIMQSFAIMTIIAYLFYFAAIILGLLEFRLYSLLIPVTLSFLVSVKSFQSWNFILHRPYVNSVINLIQIAVFLLGCWLFVKSNNPVSPKVILSLYALASVIVYALFTVLIFKPVKMAFNDLSSEKLLIHLPFQLIQGSFVLFAQIIYLVLNGFRPQGYEMVIVVFEYYLIGNMIFIALATPLWAEVREHIHANGESGFPVAKVFIAMLTVFLVTMFFLHAMRNYLFEEYTGRSWGDYSQTPYVSVYIYVMTFALVVFISQILNAIEKLYSQLVCHAIAIVSFLVLVGYLSVSIGQSLLLVSITNLLWVLWAAGGIYKSLKIAKNVN